MSVAVGAEAIASVVASTVAIASIFIAISCLDALLARVCSTVKFVSLSCSATVHNDRCVVLFKLRDLVTLDGLASSPVSLAARCDRHIDLGESAFVP